MSDQSTTATPSAPPPAPTGPPPKVTNRGRTAVPIASSNFDAADIPEFEHFGTVGPRGLPPLTGEGEVLRHLCIYEQHVCNFVLTLGKRIYMKAHAIKCVSGLNSPHRKVIFKLQGDTC